MHGRVSSSKESGGEGAFDGFAQALRFGRGPESLDHFPLPVDQEFAEIPLDALAAQNARFLTLEPNIQRMGTGAVDLRSEERRVGKECGARGAGGEDMTMEGEVLY